MDIQVLDYLKAHFEYVFIFAGLLILIGAICNWKWITQPTQEDKNDGFKGTIIDIFGQQGYRVLMGLCGAALIVCGVLYLIYGH